MACQVGAVFLGAHRGGWPAPGVPVLVPQQLLVAHDRGHVDVEIVGADGTEVYLRRNLDPERVGEPGRQPWRCHSGDPISVAGLMPGLEIAKPGSPTVRRAAGFTSQGYCPSPFNRAPTRLARQPARVSVVNSEASQSSNWETGSPWARDWPKNGERATEKRRKRLRYPDETRRYPACRGRSGGGACQFA